MTSRTFTGDQPPIPRQIHDRRRRDERDDAGRHTKRPPPQADALTPYSFAAFSYVIFRRSASGTPWNIFSIVSRECGQSQPWCG